eukprot:scaffold426_cov319-Pavlova_lutheri.AAC.39
MDPGRMSLGRISLRHLSLQLYILSGHGLAFFAFRLVQLAVQVGDRALETVYAYAGPIVRPRCGHFCGIATEVYLPPVHLHPGRPGGPSHFQPHPSEVGGFDGFRPPLRVAGRFRSGQEGFPSEQAHDVFWFHALQLLPLVLVFGDGEVGGGVVMVVDAYGCPVVRPRSCLVLRLSVLAARFSRRFAPVDLTCELFGSERSEVEFFSFGFDPALPLSIAGFQPHAAVQRPGALVVPVGVDGSGQGHGFSIPFSHRGAKPRFPRVQCVFPRHRQLRFLRFFPFLSLSFVALGPFLLPLEASRVRLPPRAMDATAPREGGRKGDPAPIGPVSEGEGGDEPSASARSSTGRGGGFADGWEGGPRGVGACGGVRRGPAPGSAGMDPMGGIDRDVPSKKGEKGTKDRRGKANGILDAYEYRTREGRNSRTRRGSRVRGGDPHPARPWWSGFLCEYRPHRPIIATSHWVKAFPKIGTRRGSDPGRRTTRPLLHPRIEPKDLDGDLDTAVEDVDGRRDSPGSPAPTDPHPPTRGWEILAIHVSKTIYKTDRVPRNPSIPRSKFPKPSHFCNAIPTDRKRETIESRLIGTNPCVVSCFGPCFGPAKARTFRPSLPRCARPGRGLFARTRQEGPTSST